MSEDRRRKIIEAGAKIIHAKGFNHTGIQEILSAAGVPKGSFYFYFKSKDDFGLHVIDFFANISAEFVGGVLGNKTLKPIQRFERLFEQFMELFRSQECCCGCPIGNLAQEMSDLNPDFRERINEAFNFQIGLYTTVLEEAQALGEISTDFDAAETARFMIRSLHGALMHMKVTKTLEPLENWRQFIFKRVL